MGRVFGGEHFLDKTLSILHSRPIFHLVGDCWIPINKKNIKNRSFAIKNRHQMGNMEHWPPCFPHSPSNSRRVHNLFLGPPYICFTFMESSIWKGIINLDPSNPTINFHIFMECVLVIFNWGLPSEAYPDFLTFPTFPSASFLTSFPGLRITL